MYNQVYFIHAKVNQCKRKIVQLNIFKFKFKSLVSYTCVHVSQYDSNKS